MWVVNKYWQEFKKSTWQQEGHQGEFCESNKMTPMFPNEAATNFKMKLVFLILWLKMIIANAAAGQPPNPDAIQSALSLTRYAPAFANNLSHVNMANDTILMATAKFHIIFFINNCITISSFLQEAAAGCWWDDDDADDDDGWCCDADDADEAVQHNTVISSRVV
jgi:hypothetical protein